MRLFAGIVYIVTQKTCMSNAVPIIRYRIHRYPNIQTKAENNQP
jgi:hypothetical protein